MRVVGIELSGSEMRYVIIDREGEAINIHSGSRFLLGGTRSQAALMAFQTAVVTLINESEPVKLGIKDKPETGRLRAGAAALKMEGIVLANSRCEVEFVSGRRVNLVQLPQNNLPAYLQPALATAIALTAE